MLTQKYKLINNIGGWFVFIIALITYWLTLEPTASYWDCGEFIIQADKLEIGHPPGNPIFMLTARFFANFASSAETVSVMVNAMSGLLSALTILLLFWTITHLVRRLVVKDNSKKEISLQKYIIIMGSGLVGSLAYCWSDTFWFSAVEGEVYAFSSFCTALVFWLILKWENRADEPHSDRYLILIAYIIGVSVAVHLLNLLCIPAIVLVFAYKRWPGLKLTGSLMALLVSFVIIALVLFGLVPGFIKVAQISELIFVNGFHLGFNSGALAYAIIMIISFLWALYELRKQNNALMIKLSFLVAVTLSGMLFIGDGVTIGIVLTIALIAYLWFGLKSRGVPVRVFNIIMWSMAVIFVGYSSYAMILIRSTADTPMNQNSPDNVFDLASYLNREQYGETPLLYGQTLYSGIQRTVDGAQNEKRGKAEYAKGVAGGTPDNYYLTQGDKNNNTRLAEKGGDYYVKKGYKTEYVMNPELNMVFPRLYSSQHAASYKNWVALDTMPGQLVSLSMYDPATGQNVPNYDMENAYRFTAYKPTFAQNLAYFFNYQLNHMYLRYFLWNFVGRQNDVLNQRGELDAGNWISGIPFIDNPRLGDQSLLPDALGKENAGNNKYYFLPLILGLIGLIWQSFAGRRGIEQFWVVFFLFFMTGIAIVLYLNQTPDQPRERDYAFAGSFYAFAVWIGMGVAGLWRIALFFIKGAQNSADGEPKATAADMKLKEVDYDEPEQSPELVNDPPASLVKPSLIGAVAALVLGICIPLQMVSQTWDDHDRSGRYAARDYAVNYLESLEPNAIVFCNGDNDTFPLWYVQEVEGVRPDVRIINLSYLNSDWYANQHRMQSYEAAPTPMTAQPADIAYGRMDLAVVEPNRNPVKLLESLKEVYKKNNINPDYGYPTLKSCVLTIPVDKKLVVERGLVAPQDSDKIVDDIVIDLAKTSVGQRGYLTIGEILMLDILATNAAQGWPRPIYWASTVGESYYLGLSPYMRSTGMTYQLVPTLQADKESRPDRAYANITKKYRWGGADGEKTPYFDETARRMLYSVRMSMVDLAQMLYTEGVQADEKGDKAQAKEKFAKALEVLNLLEAKLPQKVATYDAQLGTMIGRLYHALGEELNDAKAKEKALAIVKGVMQQELKTLQYYFDVNSRFVNAPLTYTTQIIPYQYYSIVDTYLTCGGTMDEVNKIIAPAGVTLETLKQYYDAYNNADAFSAGGDSDLGSLEELGLNVLNYCQLVNELAALSPEEYANASADEHLVDSLLEAAIQLYLESGGSEETLKKSDDYNKVDRQRSKRLFSEYEKNNGGM